MQEDLGATQKIDFFKGSSRFVELFHNAYTAWVILAISLSLTVVAYFVAESFVTRRASDRFDFKVEEVKRAIANRSLIYEQVLWGGVGLFNAYDTQVERSAFAAYVDTLDINEHWPGIQGVGYSIPVSKAELPSHIQGLRDAGFEDYSVRPQGERDEYSAIIYLEPFDWRNQRAFGYDMWSNATRREAMARARDEGVAATSGVIQLKQETDTDVQQGFLMYTPVYKGGTIPQSQSQRRELFAGWVYAPFRAGNLMKGIIPNEDFSIDFEIYDGTDITETQLLFDSNNSLHLTDLEHNPDFSKTVQVTLQGRPWTLYFNSPPDYLSESVDANQPVYIATAGVIVDVLLFYVIYSLYMMNRRMKSVGEDWRRIIDQAPSAIIVVSEEGQIVDSNSQASCLLGYQTDELRGQLVETLFPNRVRQRFPRFLEHSDLAVQRKDGTIAEVEVGHIPLAVSGGQYVVVSLVDTTEWRRVQNELKLFNSQLTQKNQEMEQFIFTVSHDLKAPLVSIGGFTDFLIKSLKDQLTDKSLHKLNRIQYNVDYMNGLLEDLLQLSRVIRQDVEKKAVSIGAVVDDVSTTLEVAIKNANATIITDDGNLTVYANERLVTQCLQNLISNGIQYRDVERAPVITIKVEKKQETTLVHVEDNGIGIEPDYHEKVFRIFERLDKGEGTGVGLAIVKTVMEKHGGQVNLRSKPGIGSIFSLEFPNE